MRRTPRSRASATAGSAASRARRRARTETCVGERREAVPARSEIIAESHAGEGGDSGLFASRTAR